MIVERFNKINNNIKDVQEKLATLRENKARNEATLEGIAARKKDLFYSINAELNIADETKLLSMSELNTEELPSIDNQILTVEKIRKMRESMGTVNLRADIEEKEISEELNSLELEKNDLLLAIKKLRVAINQINEQGKKKLIDAFELVNKNFSEIFEKEVIVFPTASGTAANALALSTMTPSFGNIYCHKLSHINTDECGAPEFYTGGGKLVTLKGINGKITDKELDESYQEWKNSEQYAEMINNQFELASKRAEARIS